MVADARAFAAAGVEIVGDALARSPEPRVCFATGETPKPLYAALVAAQANGTIDLKRIRAWLLDEYFPMTASNPRSFRAFMHAHLFDPIGLAAGRVDSLDGSAGDPDAECARYEASISGAGGFDLCFLGIGLNGHIAFNESGSGAATRARRVVLSERTRRANAHEFPSLDAVPREALTVGVGTILERSRSIVLMARGSNKAEVLARTLFEAETDALPASHLQGFRGTFTVLADEAAAALIPNL